MADIPDQGPLRYFPVMLEGDLIGYVYATEADDFAEFVCVRRRKRTTHFGNGGPVISAETDHPFRAKWTTLRLTAGRG